MPPFDVPTSSRLRVQDCLSSTHPFMLVFEDYRGDPHTITPVTSMSAIPDQVRAMRAGDARVHMELAGDTREIVCAADLIAEIDRENRNEARSSLS